MVAGRSLFRRCVGITLYFQAKSDHILDLSRELLTELTEEYSNEATPSDGEVYRKIRQYQYEASARFEQRWLARLSENKQKRLRQLSQPENASIRSAFDALLPIPGLWSAMSIGNLPRVIALKCDEVRIIPNAMTLLLISLGNRPLPPIR
jgi:Protein of unknown function (DUF3723)